VELGPREAERLPRVSSAARGTITAVCHFCKWISLTEQRQTSGGRLLTRPLYHSSRMLSRQSPLPPSLLQSPDLRGLLPERKPGFSQILAARQQLDAWANPRRSGVNGQCNNPTTAPPPRLWRQPLPVGAYGCALAPAVTGSVSLVSAPFTPKRSPAPNWGSLLWNAALRPLGISPLAHIVSALGARRERIWRNSAPTPAMTTLHQPYQWSGIVFTTEFVPPSITVRSRLPAFPT